MKKFLTGKSQCDRGRLFQMKVFFRHSKLSANVMWLYTCNSFMKQQGLGMLLAMLQVIHHSYYLLIYYIILTLIYTIAHWVDIDAVAGYQNRKIWNPQKTSLQTFLHWLIQFAETIVDKMWTPPSIVDLKVAACAMEEEFCGENVAAAAIIGIAVYSYCSWENSGFWSEQSHAACKTVWCDVFGVHTIDQNSALCWVQESAE